MMGYEQVKVYFLEQIDSIRPYVQPLWDLFSDYAYLQIAFLVIMMQMESHLSVK